jgi:hypothetical protein
VVTTVPGPSEPEISELGPDDDTSLESPLVRVLVPEPPPSRPEDPGLGDPEPLEPLLVLLPSCPR